MQYINVWTKKIENFYYFVSYRVFKSSSSDVKKGKKSFLQYDAGNSKSLSKQYISVSICCLFINFSLIKQHTRNVLNKNKVMFLRDFVDFFVIITTDRSGKNVHFTEKFLVRGLCRMKPKENNVLIGYEFQFKMLRLKWTKLILARYK